MDKILGGAREILTGAREADTAAQEAQKGSEAISAAAAEQSAACDEAVKTVEQQTTALSQSEQAANELSELADELKNSTDIGKSAEEVASASEELSSAVEEINRAAAQIMTALQQINAGGQHQGAATQQAPAAVMQIKRSAQIANDRAGAALETGQIMSQTLSVNRSAMDQMIAGVLTSVEENGRSREQIKSLEQVSRRIDKIVDAITTVSIQTNMLAVSLSVLAALTAIVLLQSGAAAGWWQVPLAPWAVSALAVGICAAGVIEVSCRSSQQSTATTVSAPISGAPSAAQFSISTGRDRRSHVRYPVAHSVLLEVRGVESCKAMLRDISDGGARIANGPKLAPGTRGLLQIDGIKLAVPFDIVSEADSPKWRVRFDLQGMARDTFLRQFRRLLSDPSFVSVKDR